MRHVIAFALVLALVLPTRPALALRPEVVRAVELQEELRFDEARAAFERALGLEGNRPDDLAAIHLHLGLLHGAADREQEAESHFRLALAIDPRLELPGGQPPKITRPFARARQFWAGGRLRVDHTPPSGWTVGSPAELGFGTVDDRLHMVTAARLAIGREDGGRERTYRQDGPGPFLFAVPPELLLEEGEIRYRIELLGAAAAILLAVEGEDLSVEVGPRPAGPVPDVRFIERTGQAPRPRLYEQWWFWTVLGVVVAGAAAGTAAALLVPGEGVEVGRPLLTP